MYTEDMINKQIDVLHLLQCKCVEGGYFGDIELAIIALEKQIPIVIKTDCDEEFDCPVCGKTTEEYDVTTIKFCPECGQKLKWD